MVRRALRWGVRGGLVLAALVAVYVLVTFVQVWRASRADEAGPADAIVVLGAAQYDGQPSPVLESRLAHTLALWEAGYADVVVVTGGGQPGDRFTEATASANWLLERGVPDDAILREVQGGNTWESLAATARILEDRGLESVLLVSDDYHSYRVAAIAEEVGLDARTSPAEIGYGFVTEARNLLRETAAVSVGRVIGYRRLVRLDDELQGVRAPVATG
ncbi:MAG TPA: YdcF family protein [Acidimicrobiales bacterium]